MNAKSCVTSNFILAYWLKNANNPFPFFFISAKIELMFTPGFCIDCKTRKNVYIQPCVNAVLCRRQTSNGLHSVTVNEVNSNKIELMFTPGFCIDCKTRKNVYIQPCVNAVLCRRQTSYGLHSVTVERTFLVNFLILEYGHMKLQNIAKSKILNYKIRNNKIRNKTSYWFKYIRVPLPLLGFCFCMMLVSGCKSSQPIQKSGFYFDTIITVTLYDSTKTDELEHCFQLANTYEQYFSAKRPDSDISSINQAGGKPVQVHDETRELIEKGIAYSARSDGKFDLTIGKLTKLWDFQTDTPTLPDADKIANAVKTIGYENVQIRGNEVTLLNPDIEIDLGGIAKGYIADKMKEYLISKNITSGMINLGGNVLTIGEKQNGDAYTIGLQKPFDQTGTAIASVKIKDQTVVTSGTYERYFKQDGILYHHILDPKTGYPYDNELSSVSVICKHSVDGDALSTTCFALGLEKGMAFIESLEDTEAVFITSDQKMHYSSGIGNKIPIQKIDP